MKRIQNKINLRINQKTAAIVILFFMISSTNVIGISNTDNKQIKQNSTYIEDFKIVKVILQEQYIIGKLIDQDIPIIKIDPDNYIIVLASKSDLNWLENTNFSYEIIFNSFAEMQGWDKNPGILRDFTSYAELTVQLQDIADTYPDIAELYDLGQSVQGRTIWGLKITDNPDIEENEPEVRICGCHHGNELMSVELPLLLAWYLVDNYNTDPYIEDLVDNRETWIIPMQNPDGREANTRYNANGVDLNRDYGYMWNGEGSSPAPFSQPETKVIRDNALENNFVLSLSFHTSGDIVNYVWNYKTLPVPDNAAVVYLSQQYGSHNGYWVVEGYDWYQVRGDTNDFSYGCRGDIDWTIEVQNNDIPGAWNLNRDAMLEIIDGANMGLSGVVTDSTSGQPVEATVWVEEAYWPCFTDKELGDYHKVLLPGTYNVCFRANGYLEEVHTVEVTDIDESAVLDVSLDRGGDCYAYQVTLCNFYDPYGYPNNFQNNPTEAVSALGPPDDICASLGKGGMIELDMGVNVINQDGDDFKIFEGDGSDDGYSVKVAQEWNGPWVDVGSGYGTTEFDLDDGSIDWIRYVKIQDDNDGNAYDTNPGVDIDAVENLAGINMPPFDPEQPDGPSSGSPLTEYAFSTNTTDPENEDVYYMWDWGDESYSEWLGPYNSGDTIQTNNSWENEGSYIVKVKAKDINNAESDWSDPLVINIGQGPILEIDAITGGLFKVGMVIKNTGPADAYGINWSISLDGGFIPFGRLSTGKLVGIPAGGQTTVYSDAIIGLGKPKIICDAEISDVTADSKEVDGVVFLFLINIK